MKIYLETFLRYLAEILIGSLYGGLRRRYGIRKDPVPQDSKPEVDAVVASDQAVRHEN